MADGCELGHLYPFPYVSSSRSSLSSVNQARALRIIEITTDYQRLQHQLASFRSYLVGPHTQGEGYVLLQACLNEAQTLLAHPFNTSAIHPRGNEEVEKTQLRQYVQTILTRAIERGILPDCICLFLTFVRVLMDASIRRFKAQKLYMRAVAAVHWIHARNGILKDQPPRFEHADPLRRISVMYRQVRTSFPPPLHSISPSIRLISFDGLAITLRGGQTHTYTRCRRRNCLGSQTRKQNTCFAASTLLKANGSSKTHRSQS